jgi:hypothetical protein
MLRTRDEGASLYRPPPRPLRRSSSYDISSDSIPEKEWRRAAAARLA